MIVPVARNSMMTVKTFLGLVNARLEVTNAPPAPCLVVQGKGKLFEGALFLTAWQEGVEITAAVVSEEPAQSSEPQKLTRKQMPDRKVTQAP